MLDRPNGTQRSVQKESSTQSACHHLGVNSLFVLKVATASEIMGHLAQNTDLKVEEMGRYLGPPFA